MTQLVGDLLKKKIIVFPSVLLSTNPLPLPSPPLFFCRCERIAVGRQLYFMVLFSPEPLVSVQYFYMAIVFVIYITQVF